MRWRLTQPHYLIVPGTEWEYKETDRGSGRQGRKVYSVPLYLHPEQPADWNYPGEVVVAHAGKNHQARDYIFEGNPTPDMEPLDDEAQALSDSLQVEWKHPIDSLPGQGYSQSLLMNFEKQLAAAMTDAQKNMSLKGISEERFEELQKQVAALVEQNAQLTKQLSDRVQPKPRV